MNWYAYNFLVTERVATRRGVAEATRRGGDRARLRGWLRRRSDVQPIAAGGDVAARGPGSADGTAAAAISAIRADGVPSGVGSRCAA